MPCVAALWLGILRFLCSLEDNRRIDVENLSKIDRRFIEQLLSIYGKSIEHLSNIDHWRSEEGPFWGVRTKLLQPGEDAFGAPVLEVTSVGGRRPSLFHSDEGGPEP